MGRNAIVAAIVLIAATLMFNQFVKARIQNNIKNSNDATIIYGEKISNEFEEAWLNALRDSNEALGDEIIDDLNKIKVSILLDEVVKDVSARFINFINPVASNGFDYFMVNDAVVWSDRDLYLEHTNLVFDDSLKGEITSLGEILTISYNEGWHWSVKVLSKPVSYRTLELNEFVPPAGDVVFTMTPGLTYVVYIDDGERYFCDTVYVSVPTDVCNSARVIAQDATILLVSVADGFEMSYDINSKNAGNYLSISWILDERVTLDDSSVVNSDNVRIELEVGNNSGIISFLRLPRELAIVEEKIIEVKYTKMETFGRWDGVILVDRSTKKTFVTN